MCDTCKDEGGFTIVKKAGETVLYRDIDGSFKETTLKADSEQWKECECIEIRRLNRLIESSAISEEFRKMSFGNFDTSQSSADVKRMKEIAFEYCKNFQQIRSNRVNSILLSGQAGSGKTHLLTAVSNNLMFKNHIPVLYFPFFDGMNNIAANNFERKDEIVQRMKDVKLLFIDDLFKPIGGKVNIKDWQTKIIFEVVNHRYLNKMPILASTELAIGEMVEIDEALASRIFEMASDYTVTVNKSMINNYRLRKLQGA